MDTLEKLASLCSMLKTLESDIGLANLSNSQKTVLYALRLLSQKEPEVPLSELQKHSLISEISRPTFFRALKFLTENEYIKPIYYKGGSSYKITFYDR